MKKRILCYGDSNTWGYVAGTGKRFDENERWTGVLQNLLGDSYTVLEEGLSGRTTCYDAGFDPLLNGLSSLGYVLKTDMPLDVAVVLLGTNDLSWTDINKYEKGITELVRRIKNANYIIRSSTPVFPDGQKILLVSPIPYGIGYTGSANSFENSKFFPEVTKRVADSLEVDFLDPSALISSSELDGIHFTKESHLILGRQIYDKLILMGI